jgi:hypothetical protein
MAYVEDGWRMFHQELALRGISCRDIEVLQQAFYGGACFAMRFLLELQCSEPPSDQDIVTIDDVVGELRCFHESRGIAPTRARTKRAG